MIDKVLQFVVTSDWAAIGAHFLGVLAALGVIVHALLGVAMMLPGKEPQATLRKLAGAFDTFINWVEKYSNPGTK